jgi:LacI family transcriptional regulator
MVVYTILRIELLFLRHVVYSKEYLGWPLTGAPSMRRPPHVALLIETSRELGRGMLRGVARYVREHGPWSLYHRPLGLGDRPPPWLKDWRGDGILARIDNQSMARAVLNSGVPAIDLRGTLPEFGLPHVGCANPSIVRLAWEHLLDRGLRHFAFCGIPRGKNRFQDLRCDLFRRTVQQAGHECNEFPAGSSPGDVEPWERQQRRIAQWLASLPKPVGVMCGFDDRALEVLDASRRAGIAIPDEVALVSVDNDEYICRLADPPLTSIDVNPEEIGYQAAALLERMMNGAKAPRQPVEIEPRGIVTRRSTDILAIDDSQAAAAIRFIRDRACEGINVADVLTEFPRSRSSLERAFKTILGRTPKAEILRVQLERAKNLLARTDLAVADVAAKAGFRSLTYFSAAFRRTLGVSPGAYRVRSGKRE